MTTEITAMSEQEILALAISLEEEDARIYRDLAEKVRARFPGAASILDSMREEETSHVTRFNGEHNAGVQVLNTQTADFPDDFGPLRHVK